MLLTVLGEYVLPARSAVWQETLVGALESLGYRVQAARQAISRSAGAGWIATERHGRRSRVQLTDEGVEMLGSGASRIYGFGEPWEWDGRWLLVAVRVPEERRDIRHRMRTRLAWEGFGSLGGGLWISPHVEREGALDELFAGEDGMLVSFRAEAGSLGDLREAIQAAWDLAEVEREYEGFIDRFGRLSPRSPPEIFRAQTELVHEWRRFPFLDPDLPRPLLPKGWPLSRAHSVFSRKHEGWGKPAQDYFRLLEAGASASAGSSSNSSRTASK